MLKNCVMCGIEINVRRKDTMYCADCKKTKQVQWSMEYKKRKIPTTAYLFVCSRGRGRWCRKAPPNKSAWS